MLTRRTLSPRIHSLLPLPLKFSIVGILILASASLPVVAADLSVCVHKKTGVTRFALKCKKAENPFKIATLLTAGAGAINLQDEVALLHKDVDHLMGIPAADPIGTFDNDFMKVTVLGLTKQVSTSTGAVAFNATFQIQNKTASVLYLAWDRVAGFSVLDNNGISASCTGLSGSGCSQTGIAELRSDAKTLARADFSSLAPGAVVSFGLVTNFLGTAVSPLVGNRFNLTFDILRYRDPDLVTGAFDVSTVGFAGIAARP